MKLPPAFPGLNVKVHDSNEEIVQCGNNGIWSVFILDESGSMATCRSDTIGGVNTYLSKLDSTTRVTLVKFSTSHRIIHDNQLASNITFTEKDYDPLGGTSLNDAVGGIITLINSRLAAMEPENRPTVVFCIVTDGEENSSRTYTTEQIKTLISKARDMHWGFTFLGADIDSFKAGNSYGISVNSTSNFNKASISDTFASASAYTKDFSETYTSGISRGLSANQLKASLDIVGYSDDDRKKMLGE